MNYNTNSFSLNFFSYRDNELYIEDIPVSELVANYDTPLYIYSKNAIEKNFLAYKKNLPSECNIHYAVKANSNLSILRFLHELNAKFDVVSGGELYKVMQVCKDASDCVFSGVGKTDTEISYALENNILSINVESLSEIYRIQRIAKQKNVMAPISIRINPDIKVDTHKYITTGSKNNKFGIAYTEAINILSKIFNTQEFTNLKLIGVSYHIGSQIVDLKSFSDALNKILDLIQHLNSLNIFIPKINIGGGLGVKYTNEDVPSIEDYCNVIKNIFLKRNCNLPFSIEPGRSVIANTALLITKIEYIKFSYEKYFAIVDAGMNDNIRPALYDAYHNIIPVFIKNDLDSKSYDIVGPVCETADVFGVNRNLKIKEADFLAICDAGAYASSMSSNYNSRPRACEVLVDKNSCSVIRRREVYNDLIVQEIFKD